MGDTEFIIVGDTKDYKECLVCLAETSRTYAEERLDKLVNHPSETDLVISAGHTNLRIKEVESKDCWWNDPYLCN